MRTLVIGLDGVGFPVLDPLIERDVVPNIGRFRDRSAAAPLESQLPPWTPSAWPSIYTGVNPGKHGVYDFLRFDGYDWTIANRDHVKEHAVWELLSMEGYTSVVLNVPVTHPPRRFDGVLVPGYTAPEEADCHPSGVRTELEAELGEYRLYTETPGASTTKRERVRGYERLTRMRGVAFRTLVEKHDPDFGFVQFQQCDSVFHDFPGDDDVVRGVFEAIDREVGAILTACDPDVVLIVSDHGIGPMNGYEFRVNNYLRETGFVTATASGEGMPSWKSVSRKRSRRGESGGSTTPTVLERAVEGLARAGITSQRIGAAAKRLGIDDVVLELAPDDVVRAGGEQVDFASSVAYMRSRTEMGVRLNLEGREPAGVVSPTEYERTRTAVIDVLEGVTTPDGDPVFEGVYPREDVYEGPYLEDAPDIVTVPNGFDQFLVANLKESRFGEPTEPWEHKLDGIVMAGGAGVETDATLTDPHVFDIAPTVLATFGLPSSDRMDGAPLPIVEPIGRTEYVSFEPKEPARTDSTTVEQRLADLGYLE
ncbi:alkaline phosphatase family protein [Natronococcus sp. A-GB7]|uniref:alkaline phosphatase family protein n=1 Tax=Natronococcus sp. A-GB7 TaxID=3037649 RepID=UPI00241CB502|nr:alkaline phosphatase family protein [Natronococcus sp. A-GB7]MDG5819758.1 alkaline phosphatase family protein [Natronococcus sp. A-GB7]